MVQDPKFLPHIVQPKKITTSFMEFSKSNGSALRKQNPDLKTTEVAKKIGEKWTQLTDDEKAPYIKIVKKDTIRYQNEIQELLKNGLFINSDGVKSTDLKVKIKRIMK